MRNSFVLFIMGIISVAASGSGPASYSQFVGEWNGSGSGNRLALKSSPHHFPSCKLAMKISLLEDTFVMDHEDHCHNVRRRHTFKLRMGILWDRERIVGVLNGSTLTLYLFWKGFQHLELERRGNQMVYTSRFVGPHHLDIRSTKGTLER